MNDDVIDEIDEQQQPQQQPAAAVDAVAVTAARKTTRLKLITFLEQYDEFPIQTRNHMDALAENYLRTAENNVHLMLCDNRHDGDEYRGLDSSRDTEDEVEAIVRFFPDALSRESDDNEFIDWGDGEVKYPIQFLTSMFTGRRGPYRCNLKAVSFIQLLARLAFECGSFPDHERGGLLCEDSRGYNTLQYLADSSSMRCGEEHNQFVDDEYLTQLIRLRQIGLLKIEDIQDHRLVHRVISDNYFPGRRFRYLVEWNPVSLLQTDEIRFLPLHYTACQSTIQGFRCAFELGIRYYPIKKGISLLFAKVNDADTPFQVACNFFRRDEVVKVIEETLLLSSQQRQQQQQRVADDDDGNNNTNSVGPYNIVDAFLTAAMDERIHFDCVYFLLRRQPDLLKRLLSGTMTTNGNVANGTGGGGSDSHDDSDNDHDEIDNGNVRDDDIATHLNCKKDDNNNGKNDKDNCVEKHVDGKNNNDDGNNKKYDDNEMMLIVNSIANANAEANSNTTTNNGKRKRTF